MGGSAREKGQESGAGRPEIGGIWGEGGEGTRLLRQTDTAMVGWTFIEEKRSVINLSDPKKERTKGTGKTKGKGKRRIAFWVRKPERGEV